MHRALKSVLSIVHVFHYVPMILVHFLFLFPVSAKTFRSTVGAGEPFNVRAYGAKGDGKTDDTKAIQAAINAASVKGGVVFFPNGIYHIGGAIIEQVDGKAVNAQLYIPHIDGKHSRNIILQGETAPEFEMQGIMEIAPSVHGAILYSSMISNNPEQAVLAMQKGPDGSWSKWNYMTPSLRDLGVRTRTIKAGQAIVNSLGAINFRDASKCHLDQVLIDTDGPLSTSISPEAGGSTGLILPEVNNHAMVHVGLIRIAGYAVGLRFSEHFVGTDIQLVCCHIGAISEASHHSSSIQTLEVECCNYSLLFKPGHNLFISNYNTEHFTDDKWFQFKKDIVFEGENYHASKVIIGLCHPVVSYVGYRFEDFTTSHPDRVVLLEKR